MSDKDKATERPWLRTDPHPLLHAAIMGPQGRVVAKMCLPTPVIGSQPSAEAQIEQAEANADLIVRAVNSHDKLTRDNAALTEQLDRFKGLTSGRDKTIREMHEDIDRLVSQNAALVAALENSLKPLHAVHDGAKIILHDPRLTCSVCETIREAEAAVAAAKPQPTGNAGWLLHATDKTSSIVATCTKGADHGKQDT